MKEQKGAVTFQGAPLTLVGELAGVGSKAKDFTLLDNGLSPVSLGDYAGKVVVLVTVPSLDTPVCDKESRRFIHEAESFGDDVELVIASMDLPFAQARWSADAGVSVNTLSAHSDTVFAEDYGVLVKELRLLARAVIIIDRTGTVGYVQLVKEITEEPDYDAVLAGLAGIA